MSVRNNFAEDSPIRFKLMYLRLPLLWVHTVAASVHLLDDFQGILGSVKVQVSVMDAESVSGDAK